MKRFNINSNDGRGQGKSGTGTGTGIFRVKEGRGWESALILVSNRDGICLLDTS